MLVEGSLEAYWHTEYGKIKKNQKNQDYGGLARFPYLGISGQISNFSDILSYPGQ